MARKVYYLDKDFGLDQTKGNRTVGSDMTLSQAQGLFPQFYARMRGRGPMFLGRPLTDDEFMRLSWFDACWGEALVQGNGGFGNVTSGVIDSKNDIVVPFGTYRHFIPVEYSAGEYTMQGPGYTDLGNSTINTKLEVGHEGWLGHPLKRNSLVATTWDTSGSYSYIEGTKFHGFELDGRQDLFPTVAFESNGILAWKPGEITDSDRIMFKNYRTRGAVFFAPTPHRIGNFSCFHNVVAGVGFAGSWGGTVTVDMLSGDDNGALFELFPQSSTEAGGILNFNAIKFENMIASTGRTYRGGCVGILRGQFLVNINVMSAMTSNGVMPTAFVVDDRLTGGTPQPSALRVGLKGAKYQTLVHDLRRGRTFASKGDYKSGWFEYDTESGVLVHLAKERPFTDGQATFRVHPRTGTSGLVDMSPTAAPYRDIIVGPPAVAVPVYLDSVVAGPTSGGSTAGSTGSTAGSTGSTAGSTGSTAGSTAMGSRIPAADVVVLANTAEAGSLAMAQAYAAARGIPAANVVQANLGTAQKCTDAQVTSARALITKGQYVVLAFRYPYATTNDQSITSAVTFGPRNPAALTVSALYGYEGYKPFTDKGVRPSSHLISQSYIRVDADGTNPTGACYLMLAKDSPSQNNPRGSARAAQSGVTGLITYDSRSIAGLGGGENPCNVISNECWIAARKPYQPIVAHFESLYRMGYDTGLTFRKGHYGDHLTSDGGNIAGAASGQTPLTWHLDRGAAASAGTVAEPWQDKAGNSAGSLVEQFVDVRRFLPLWRDKKLEPIVAVWASIKCPDRTLVAGDGLTKIFT